MSDMSFVGREQTVKALGRDWKLSRCELEHWTQFREWAITQLPDPKKNCAELLAMLPKDDIEARKTAVERTLAITNNWLSIGSESLVSLMNTFEGITKMVQVLLQKYQPGTSDAEAWNVVMAVGEMKAHELAAVAAGKVPKKDKSPGVAKPPPTHARKKSWTGQRLRAV